LARNTWKFKTRDKRKRKVQNVEFDSLAPDTVEEILKARRLLEIWTARAQLNSKGESAGAKDDQELAKIGQELLQGPEDNVRGLEVLGEAMEKSKRKVVIVKPYAGYEAYGQMLHYYAVKNLMEYLENHQSETFSSMCEALGGEREQEWVNLGGQLMPAGDLDQVRSDIGRGRLNSWDEIHERYDALWESYTLAKQRHAFATLSNLYGDEMLGKDQWDSVLERAADIQEIIRERVYTSRKKDFDNPFRRATYRNLEEMTAAIGTVEDNSFVGQVRDETAEFKKRIEEIKKRG